MKCSSIGGTCRQWHTLIHSIATCARRDIPCTQQALSSQQMLECSALIRSTATCARCDMPCATGSIITAYISNVLRSFASRRHGFAAISPRTMPHAYRPMPDRMISPCPQIKTSRSKAHAPLRDVAYSVIRLPARRRSRPERSRRCGWPTWPLSAWSFPGLRVWSRCRPLSCLWCRRYRLWCIRGRRS